MPRVVVISDVHGNLNALKAVWRDMTHRKADNIIFLGDLVAFGPHPKATLEFLRDTVKPDISILGNTDRYLLESAWEKKDFSLASPVPESLAWTAKAIGKKGRSYLESFSKTATFEIAGLELLLCHGSPKDDETYVTPENAESLKPAFKKVTADFVLCGHTHLPVRTRVGDVDILNAGSVGYPYDRDQRACYLSFFVGDGELRELTFCRVSYSVPLSLRDLEESKMPGADLFAHRLQTASSESPRES